jgi:hypothetical protein
MAVGLTIGCATTGDDRLRLGDFEGAARAFKHASYDGWLRPKRAAISAHLKLAALLATPGTPVYDPGEARRILERVVRRAEGSVAELEAKLLLDRLGDQLADRVAELEGQLAVALAKPDLPTRPHVTAGAEDGVPELAAELAEAQGRADRLTAEVRRLQAEIAQLKALDLAVEPAESPDPPR